jgi:hypothetical protein
VEWKCQNLRMPRRAELRQKIGGSLPSTTPRKAGLRTPLASFRFGPMVPSTSSLEASALPCRGFLSPRNLVRRWRQAAKRLGPLTDPPLLQRVEGYCSCSDPRVTLACVMGVPGTGTGDRMVRVQNAALELAEVVEDQGCDMETIALNMPERTKRTHERALATRARELARAVRAAVPILAITAGRIGGGGSTAGRSVESTGWLPRRLSDGRQAPSGGMRNDAGRSSPRPSISTFTVEATPPLGWTRKRKVVQRDQGDRVNAYQRHDDARNQQLAIRTVVKGRMIAPARMTPIEAIMSPTAWRTAARTFR